MTNILTGGRPVPHAASGRSSRGFTLVELLVAIGIIGILIAIILPAIGRTREMGYRVMCLSNGRVLGGATLAFCADNRGQLPNPNWVSLEGRNPRGWLYEAPNRGQGPSGESAPDHRRAGQLFKYLAGNADVYLCPIHDRTTFKGPTERITSYLINGAVGGYGKIPAPGTAYLLRQFPANAILFWEADEDGGVAFNDGSSYPTESLTDRHGRGATVTSFDGSAEYFYRSEWVLLQAAKPGRLWCNPQTPTGD